MPMYVQCFVCVIFNCLYSHHLFPIQNNISGLPLLIERKWLSFGHQFEKRCNFAFQDKKSPIFLQWLDCVHQLLKQCPCEFEFNEDLLVSDLFVLCMHNAYIMHVHTYCTYMCMVGLEV